MDIKKICKEKLSKKEWELIWLCVEDKCNNYKNPKLEELNKKIQEYRNKRFT